LGSRDYVEMIRDVFSNKNIIAISMTTSLFSLVGGWYPFWAKYMQESLGATPTIIGLLSMIRTSENLIFQMPGGLLADKYGRKKIIIIGTFLRTFSPIIYFFAPSWEWLIPATVLDGMTSLYMPAFTAIVADSLPSRRRGAGYGAYNMITSLPNIISPLIAGYIMEMYGYRDGIRIFLVASVIVNLIVTYIRWRILTETLDVNTKGKSIMPSRAMFTELPKTIKVMTVVAIIGSFSSRLVMDFANLYALDVIKVTPSQLGLMTSVVFGISAILALPGGMLSDKYGRKNNIMLGRLTSPISQGLVTYVNSYESYFAIRIFNGAAVALGGSGMEAGGPSWNALISDIVPSEKRATVMGTIGTLTAVVASPSSFLGGWLWQNINPQAPFTLSMVVGLISAAIFWFGVKEPTNEEKLGAIEKIEKDRLTKS
jgi:MFS family permease